jgi:hypothetical protein
VNGDDIQDLLSFRTEGRRERERKRLGGLKD